MSKKRPVYLGTDAFMGLPITAFTSISHRISGIIMFAAIPILLYMLSMSLQSEVSFNELKACMSSLIGKIVIWGIVASFTFHVVAGFRHLLMDIGIGETLQGGKIGAVVVLVASAILIVLEGVWICLPI
jgi:succinate dehydrogenase / fumarate reductase cytochrome b subunit